MIDMARKEILPAVEGYTSHLASSVAAKQSAAAEAPCGYEKKLLKKLRTAGSDGRQDGDSGGRHDPVG